ncbi:hypothetical protein [Vibrio parahaemolyticus]|nr:hypothetical protein [Vibrio parahaemolyticus]
MIEWGTVLGSGVVAGLVAGLVTLRTTERKIAIENITQQRQVWRDKLRVKAKDVTDAFENKSISKLSILCTEFSHLLNPLNDEDREILKILWDFKAGNFSEQKHVEFIERISLLLKHDWQRAKHEAKPLFFVLKEPSIVKYSEFEFKKKVDSTGKLLPSSASEK